MNNVIQIPGDIPLVCWLYDLSYRITTKCHVMKEVVTQSPPSAIPSQQQAYADTHNPCVTRRSSINRVSV